MLVFLAKNITKQNIATMSHLEVGYGKGELHIDLNLTPNRREVVFMKAPTFEKNWKVLEDAKNYEN